MTRPRAVLLAAAVAHALGWLLPVVQQYPGWYAFRAAFSPVWPFEGYRIAPGPLLWLSVASALTNVLFPALAAALALGHAGGRAGARAILWAAGGATLLNLHWPLTTRGTPVVLEAGYFAWVASFALLALAAYLALAAAPRPR